VEVVKEPSPPTGFSRLIWRFPVQLYRARLGWLLGSRFMLLRHIGRISGRHRAAVVEVVHREPGSWTAASGFGTRADWYRNVLAHPDITVRTAGHDHTVHAVPLSPDEGAALMTLYARAHTSAARSLVKIMGYRVDGSDADWAEVGRRTPFVRFEQRHDGRGLSQPRFRRLRAVGRAAGGTPPRRS
jgi:deazaflavin-dependent oxidoreductase (nitroreductase family)